MTFDAILSRAEKLMNLGKHERLKEAVEEHSKKTRNTKVKTKIRRAVVD